MSTRFHLNKGNDQYIVSIVKETIEGGEEVLQVIGHDFVITVRPRKQLRPTLILYNTNVGKIQDVPRKEDQSKAIEVFIDVRQKGIASNPVKITQRELLLGNEDKK